MDWEATYATSRALTLEISPVGQLVASASASRPPKILELDALPLLISFTPNSTPRAVLERLTRDWEVERVEFESAIDGLLEQGFLVPARDRAGGTRAPTAFDSLQFHHRMLRDVVRVTAYKNAIDRNCLGKLVVEIGCGTGLLSIFAARAGARRVVAIEEGGIADLAESLLRANGCQGTVKLLRANSLDVDLEEPADVIVHEIIGVDPLTENVLRYIEDARRRLLRPGGRMLPYRLEILCAGVELKSGPLEEKLATLAEAANLAVLYGVNFGPYIEQLSALPLRAFRSSIGSALSEPARFPFRILSEECCLLDLDFRSETPSLNGRATLRMNRRGTLGGLALYFRAHLDEETRLTTSPLEAPTSWGFNVRPLSREVPTQDGDEVFLSVRVGTHFGRQGMDVDLEDS